MFAARTCGGQPYDQLNWKLIGPSFWNSYKNSMEATIAVASVPDTTSFTGGGVNADANSVGGILYYRSGVYYVFCIPNGSTADRIYNSSTNTFISINTSGYDSFGYTGGVLLKNGKIYMVPNVGGTARIFDPGSGVTTPSGSFPTSKNFKAVLLPNGNVYCIPGNFSAGESARIYNPAANTLTTVSGTFTIGCNNGILMADGRVFCATVSGSAIIFNPTTNTLSNANVTMSPGSKAELLPDERVLIISDSAIKIYYPDLDVAVTSSVTISGVSHFTLIQNGKILILTSSGLRLYDPIFDTISTSSQTGVGSFMNLLPNGKVLMTVGGTGGSTASKLYGGGVSFNENVLLSSYYNSI
jgi:hypothetical protein